GAVTALSTHGGVVARIAVLGGALAVARLGARHSEAARAAATELALHPHAAAVGLDDALDDGEPEAGGAAPLAALPEAVEETADVLGVDARPLVAHREDDLAPARGGADAQRAAQRAVRETVVDQVGERLHEPRAIGEHPGAGVVAFAAD